MADDPIAELETLLARERDALLAGEFGGLEAFGARKESLFRRLDARRGTPARLAALKAQSERNGELLTAAARGLKTAMRRVAEIRSAHGPLKTYSPNGEAQTHSGGAGRLERRA